MSKRDDQMMEESDDSRRLRIVSGTDEEREGENASSDHGGADVSSVEEEPAPLNNSATDSDSDDADDEEEDAFFSKSFAFGGSQSDADGFDAAFAGGLRSVFEASDDDDDDESAARIDDVSDAERIQRDLELERREALDSEIMQNDADFLYEAGSKYEAPRATDDDFDRRGKSSASDDNPAQRRAVVSPESILEAMLFVGDRENRPLSLKRACELIRNVSELEALEIFADLNERYHREGAPYKIVRDGEGYRLALLDEYDDILARFGGKTKEYKLSQTAVDVLALVAYKQPITLQEILEVRSGAASVLTQLVRRDLVSVEKQMVDKKKVSVYRTTKRFLKLFNLNSIDELPVIGDIDYR